MSAPRFTGRNVPIEEIAAVSGFTAEQIINGIEIGELHFGYIIHGGNKEKIIYCPDKKVWEETGYFNNKFASGE